MARLVGKGGTQSSFMFTLVFKTLVCCSCRSLILVLLEILTVYCRCGIFHSVSCTGHIYKEFSFGWWNLLLVQIFWWKMCVTHSVPLSITMKVLFCFHSLHTIVSLNLFSHYVSFVVSVRYITIVHVLPWLHSLSTCRIRSVVQLSFVVFIHWLTIVNTKIIGIKI